MVTRTTQDTDDRYSVPPEQLDELIAAQTLELDQDFSFHLQLQEAINASPAHSPSTSTYAVALTSSSSPPPPLEETVSPTFASIQPEEFILLDVQRMSTQVALRVLEEEWGDNLKRPFGEGCSEDADKSDDHVFRLYCKGLVFEEKINEKKVALCGIGVVIYDRADNCIFHSEKLLVGYGTSKIVAETKALIEGLNAALSLELRRVQILCDFYPLYKFATRRWLPRQHKVGLLVNKVFDLQRKFRYCNIYRVARSDMKDVFKLTRAAIASQITSPADSSHGKTLTEPCFICFEDFDVGHMFSVDGCLHRYCFSCMKQHVEVKLCDGVVPKCPHQGCKTEVKVDSCRNFLSPELLEILNQRIKEASIPVTERVYCPNPRCSTLMSKSEVLEYAKNASDSANVPGAVSCVNCHGLFCINCKVPWHSNMTCNAYERLNPNLLAEDVKLKSLASMKLWRQCVQCNHMIELFEGCKHIICRCGHEFCYNCGADWNKRKATCSCPLRFVDRTLFNDSGEDSNEEEQDDNDDVES